MKLIVTILPFLIILGCEAQKKSSELNWIQLFNGKDLNNWIVKIKNHPLNENFKKTFRVENGLIKVSYDQYDTFNNEFGHIFYKDKFSAYLLVIEYRFAGTQVKGGPAWGSRNSGVMLHCQSPESMKIDQDFPISLEAQFRGGDGKTEQPTGNLCTPGTHVVMDGKLFTPHCVNSASKTYLDGQWVKAEMLVLKDSIIKHIIKRDTVIVYERPQYDSVDKWVKLGGFRGGATVAEGYISLQAESHPIEFRKVELFDLSSYMNNKASLQGILDDLSRRKSH